jgi:hypothetical protein
MVGGEDCQINVAAFLQCLTLDKFRHTLCLFIPCGRADRLLYVKQIKAFCPSVQTIVHSKWLMMNEYFEEIQEGPSHFQVHRMYRHDKEFIPGTNVWIRWCWDGKYELVSKSKFVRPTFLPSCARVRTDFLRFWIV